MKPPLLTFPTRAGETPEEWGWPAAGRKFLVTSAQKILISFNELLLLLIGVSGRSHVRAIRRGRKEMPVALPGRPAALVWSRGGNSAPRVRGR